MSRWEHFRRWIETLSFSLSALAVAGAVWFAAQKVAGVAGAAQGTVTRLNATLDAVNRPCGGGKPCGTLAEINKATVKAQDISVTVQRQVQQSGKLVDAATSNLNLVSGHLSATLDGVRQFTDAGTADLQTLNGSILQTDALLAAYTRTGETLNGQLKANAVRIASTLDNVNGTMANVRTVTGNLAVVSTKVTRDFTAKKPWWKRLPAESVDVLKIVGAGFSIAK